MAQKKYNYRNTEKLNYTQEYMQVMMIQKPNKGKELRQSGKAF